MTPSLLALDLLPPAQAPASTAAALPGEFLALLDGCLDVAVESEEKSKLGTAPVVPAWAPAAAAVVLTAESIPVAVAGPAELPQTTMPDGLQTLGAAVVKRAEDVPDPQEILPPLEKQTQPEVKTESGPSVEPVAVEPPEMVMVETQLEPDGQPVAETRPAQQAAAEVPAMGPVEPEEPAVPGIELSVEDGSGGAAPAPAKPAVGGSEEPELRIDRAAAPVPAPVPTAPPQARGPAGRASVTAQAAVPAESAQAEQRPVAVHAVERAAETAPAAGRAPRREVAFAARVVENAVRESEPETAVATSPILPTATREQSSVVALSQAEEPVSTVAAAAPEPAEPVPVRSVAVNLGDNVRIKVAEQGGEVRVVVHTPNTTLNESLREQLPQLVERLDARGFAAETWHPAAAASSRAETPHGGGTDQQKDTGGGQQQHQQRRQQQDLPEWLKELERSRGQ